MALMAQAIHSTSPPAGAVAHPWIPCWTGEGTSLTVFSTDEDEQPVRITHNHDLILEGSQISQSYNFLDYQFENEGRAFAHVVSVFYYW